MTSSALLLVFACLAFAGVAALKRAGAARAAPAWLAIVSVVACVASDPRSVPLLGLSTLVNYSLGNALIRAGHSRRALGKSLLVFGVVANLALLAYYKYLPPALDVLAALVGRPAPTVPTEIPVGISFLTFLQVAFLVDLYDGRTRPRGPADYGLFVTFFPKLIAGPIVRHEEFADATSGLATDRISRADLAEGVTLIAIGLFKKLALADGLAPHANLVFASAATGGPLSLVEAWGGSLAYTFQIYFDFSGYSDIAIGSARCLGIALPWNFNSPYKATSISDFWKRWHMTLSAFLRDYIYLPLGGKRKGTARQYLNLWITLTLCGLWHGARWGFVAWGMLHGLFLVVNHAWRKRGFRCPAPVGWALTFLAACLARVWFRADSLDAGLGVFRGLLGANGLLPPGIDAHTWVKALSVPAAPYKTLAQVLVALVGPSSFGGAAFHPVNALLSDLSLKVLYLALSAGVAFGLPNSQEFVAAARGRDGSGWRVGCALGIGLLAYLAMIASITSLEPTTFVYRRF